MLDVAKIQPSLIQVLECLHLSTKALSGKWVGSCYLEDELLIIDTRNGGEIGTVNKHKGIHVRGWLNWFPPDFLA